MKKKQGLLPILSATAVVTLMAEVFYWLSLSTNKYVQDLEIIPLLIGFFFVMIVCEATTQYIKDRWPK